MFSVTLRVFFSSLINLYQVSTQVEDNNYSLKIAATYKKTYCLQSLKVL
jgi:hypothetical protein